MPTYKSYIIGFILCLALTLAAYFAVTNGFSNAGMIIVALAIVQLVVQLIFFLHLGQGKDGHWNLTVFFSTVSVIVIFVIGSIWIMNHLNYNMMPTEVEHSLMHMENIYK